jgi:IS5 family transposase
LPDRMSYMRFCGLANSTNVPDLTPDWAFENRFGEADDKAIYDGVLVQSLNNGFFARGGQDPDAKYKVILKIETDTTSTHDSQHFNKVLYTSNTLCDVYMPIGVIRQWSG